MLYGRFSRNMPYHKKAQWNAEGGVPYKKLINNNIVLADIMSARKRKEGIHEQ